MSCCASATVDPHDTKLLNWIHDGILFWKNGKTIRLKNSWSFRDKLGLIAARLGFGRKVYRIPPGLYAIGEPDENSPVLVTANYKLTVDIVRTTLARFDSFLLVLDTRGINVWCAAGKGTFGTDELIRRIALTNLERKITHRRLILPQLGATGVNAAEVQNKTGFSVIWGPVQISDLTEFIRRDLHASAPMRSVTFTLPQRLAVTPVELAQSWKFLIPLIAVGLGLSVLKTGLLTLQSLIFPATLAIAAFIGTALFPALLPLLPGRAFSLKGALLGLLISLGATLITGFTPASAIGNGLLIAPLVGFAALNFTGAAPLTSVSGVKRETQISLPIFGGTLIAGIAAYFIL